MFICVRSCSCINFQENVYGTMAEELPANHSTPLYSLTWFLNFKSCQMLMQLSGSCQFCSTLNLRSGALEVPVRHRHRHWDAKPEHILAR